MSTKPLALNGFATEKSGDDGEELRKTRQNNQRLDDELRQVRRELEDSKVENRKLKVCINGLREQFSPLFRFLRAVNGEIELAIGEERVETRSQSPANSPSSSSNPKWESWKQKLPGKPAEIIDLLLLHESMTTKQLMAAVRCGRDAIYQAAHKLAQAGLVSNNGGRYSLKNL